MWWQLPETKLLILFYFISEYWYIIARALLYIKVEASYEVYLFEFEIWLRGLLDPHWSGAACKLVEHGGVGCLRRTAEGFACRLNRVKFFIDDLVFEKDEGAQSRLLQDPTARFYLSSVHFTTEQAEFFLTLKGRDGRLKRPCNQLFNLRFSRLAMSPHPVMRFAPPTTWPPCCKTTSAWRKAFMWGLGIRACITSFLRSSGSSRTYQTRKHADDDERIRLDWFISRY